MGYRGALLERGEELTELDEVIARAALEGGVIVIAGPAGIGKSRLVEAAIERAASFRTLSARGSALETDIAFGVVRQLFEAHVARAPERDVLLADAAAPAGQVLGLAVADVEPVGGELARSLHALFWLVANLAERGPLLLVVDDLHWADQASVEFLAYLARRIEGLPVLVVVALRDGEASARPEVLADLGDRATVLRPSPLSNNAVGELIRRVSGTRAAPELVDACHTATGGNPFFLGELLLTVAAAGGELSALPVDLVQATVPSTVARSILLRVGRLPYPAPEVAVAAAVLGDDAPLRHALAVAGVPEPEGVEAADALVRASILADARPVRFAHPIVRTAIVGDLAPATRAAMHRRAALLLRDEQQPAEVILPHVLLSPPAADAWVVDTLVEAAQHAAARGVPDIAARYLRRALDEPPAARLDVLYRLSTAELAAGDFASSAANAQQAIELAPDAAARSRLRFHHAYATLSVEGAAAALAGLDAAVAEAADADSELQLRLEGEIVLHSWFVGARHPRVDALMRHRHLPGTTPAQRYVLGVLALEAVRREEPADAVRDIAWRALAAGAQLPGEAGLTLAYFAAVLGLLASDARAEARVAIDAGAANCVATGSHFGFAGVCWIRGLQARADGNLSAAEADQRLCVDNAVPTMVGIGAASLALVLHDQGDVRAAHGVLEQHGLLDDDRPLYVFGPYTRGLVRLAQGHTAEAIRDLEDVGRHATEAGGFPCTLPWRASLAVALDADGQPERAREVSTEAVTTARRRGARRDLGVALLAAARLTSTTDPREPLEEAIALLAEAGAPLEQAHAEQHLGTALLRRGNRRVGREVLQHGYQRAQACGAHALAQSVFDELRVAGAQPRRAAVTGVDALTASERRVAEMAAAGMSNREIARDLFVTPKPVENQLGRVYSKLGVSSRRLLDDVLGRASDRS